MLKHITILISNENIVISELVNICDNLIFIYKKKYREIS